AADAQTPSCQRSPSAAPASAAWPVLADVLAPGPPVRGDQRTLQSEDGGPHLLAGRERSRQAVEAAFELAGLNEGGGSAPLPPGVDLLLDGRGKQPDHLAAVVQLLGGEDAA